MRPAVSTQKRVIPSVPSADIMIGCAPARPARGTFCMASSLISVEAVATPSPYGPATEASERSAHLRCRYALVALACFVFYWGVTTRLHFDFRQGWYPVFIFQAQAFLEGHLDLRGELPLGGNDLSFYRGRYYAYWPPLPAIVSLPAVMIWGLAASDKFMTALFAGVNVFLIGLLLDQIRRRGWIDLAPRTVFSLQVFYALGTEPFTCVLSGGGPNFALVLQETCLLSSLACLFAWPMRMRGAFWGGFFWCGCILTRAHSVLLAPFYVGFLWSVALRSGGRRWPWGRLAGLGGWAAVGALSIMAWNYTRFGSVTDSGTAYQLWAGPGSATVSQTIDHGLISPYYIPQNLYAHLIKPMFQVRSTPPYVTADAIGDGILLTTPLWFVVLWRGRRIAAHWLVRASLYGIVPVWGLLLLWYSTGGTQFGMRFLMDFLPLMFLCLAAAVAPKLSQGAMLLLVMSIAIRGVCTYLYVT